MNGGNILAGWIAPHGVVPDMPAEHLSLVPNTDAAMRQAAAMVASLAPQTVVLVTPHGFRSTTANTASVCRRNRCKLDQWYPWRSDEMEARGDPELGLAIVRAATERNLRAFGLIYGATSDAEYPMDWAITSPLRYLQEARYEGAVLPVTFSGQPLQVEWEFGQAIASAVQSLGRRIIFIASSDLSHVHSAKGPYGYKPIAKEFDGRIEDAVREDSIRSLLDLDLEWVAEAAQDGLRSIIILAGALEGTELRPNVLSYEVLEYFGMLTAIFTSEEGVPPPS